MFKHHSSYTPILVGWCYRQHAHIASNSVTIGFRCCKMNASDYRTVISFSQAKQCAWILTTQRLVGRLENGPAMNVWLPVTRTRGSGTAPAEQRFERTAAQVVRIRAIPFTPTPPLARRLMRTLYSPNPRLV